MRNFRPISIFIVLAAAAWISLSWLPHAENKNRSIAAHSPVNIDSAGNSAINAEMISLYRQMNLQALGLSEQAFSYAYKGYTKLLQKGTFSHQGMLTICDFSQSANNKRLYLIDIINQRLITTSYVAHGRNSGGEYATQFSNRPESLQSSLGFYVTRDTYMGAHGLSLRVDGLEKGYNDNAMERAIVVHGADYIGEGRLRNGSFMGRSFGCPALPASISGSIINTIKNGTCLFIYHPSRKYLNGSKILNG